MVSIKKRRKIRLCSFDFPSLIASLMFIFYNLIIGEGELNPIFLLEILEVPTTNQLKYKYKTHSTT